MKTMICNVCKREFEVTDFQYEIMKRTVWCCSSECALKLIEEEDE